MQGTNPWRDTLVAEYKARGGGGHADEIGPAEILGFVLRTVASAASHEARKQLGALAGLADQLVHTGLAIRAAQQPEDRNDVALAYREDSPRIAEDTIPAIDGWKIGCMVQSRYRGVDHADNEWRDVGIAGRPCTPNFMHPMMEYRVKPGELVSFCGGTPPIEYQPNPPLNWDEPG